MTDTLKEQLSCFLDGELPEAETTLLLKRLDRDEDLKGTLSRYSLIGAVLRVAGDAPAARNVASRVSAALAREPALRDATDRPAARWLRAVAGLAIAAGVAAAAILVLPAVQPGSDAAPARVAAAPVAPEPDEVVPVVRATDATDEPARTYTTPPASAGQGNALSPAQLASFLLAHSEYTDLLARRSLVTATPATDPPAAPVAEAGAGRQ